MSPDDPQEPSGERRRSWAPSSFEPGAHRRSSEGRSRLERVLRTKPVRGRRVRRTLRHIDPWSALKISLLFHAALFLIICVASALLWSGARASGSLDNLESFITSVGGFGNCEPIPGAAPATTTTSSTVASTDDVDQLDPSRVTTTEPEATDETLPAAIGGDEDCRRGERLVGEFRFEDARIFQAFAFGGIILVLAGAGGTLVLVLLFNLMSDLTGGVQLWMVEDEPRSRPPAGSGSPPARRRD